MPWISLLHVLVRASSILYVRVLLNSAFFFPFDCFVQKKQKKMLCYWQRCNMQQFNQRKSLTDLLFFWISFRIHSLLCGVFVCYFNAHEFVSFKRLHLRKTLPLRIEFSSKQQEELLLMRITVRWRLVQTYIPEDICHLCVCEWEKEFDFLIRS